MAASSNPLAAGVPALRPPSSTQTMISPDGQYGEIPVERVQDAIKAGFKPGMNMISPDGTVGTVPIDKAHDAMSAGFKPSGMTLPESKLYAQHPANVLYRNIRENETPEQIAARQQTAQTVSSRIGTVGQGLASAGGLLTAPVPTVAGIAASSIAQPVVEKAAKSLGVDDTTAHQIAVAAALATGIAAGKISEGVEIPGSSTLSKVSKLPSEMVGRSISPEDVSIKPAAGELQPARANTPEEVLNYAAQKRIDLTPAEASGKPLAKTIQAVGERSILGADQLAQAREANALKLAQNVRSFADNADPKGMGLTEEGAGETIQHTARVARSVAHENATAAYDQAGIDQANLAGDLSPLKNMVQNEIMVKQPSAAVARPEYKQPEVQAALNDIASKPDELGNRPSIQSMRNLRTEFLERSRVAPGEAQTAAQRLYGQAADIVNSQIMKAGQGTPFEDSFRDASEQWANLKQKFDEPGTVLNRILSQRDPANITRSILNRGSANDIAILKNENMQPAIDSLQRQVVQDVANRGFRVNGDGLGGYSDSFIQQLFGPEKAKELYLNGELARRMGFQLNPSGTSNVLLGMEQLSPQPSRFMIPMGAAKASMPRPAASYLPKSTINISDLSGGAK